MNIKKTYLRQPVFAKQQQGMSLVITIVVLLAVTSLALAATNINQSQGLMVRNAQLRLEVFNASFSEIDAQIDAINSRNLTQGPPNYVLAMIDGAVGTTVNKTTTVALPSYAAGDSSKITQVVSQEYVGTCKVLGQQLGEGFEKIQCSNLLIDSESTLIGTAVDSPQNQIYQYQTLKES